MRLLMGEDWAGPYAFDQRTRPPFVAMEKKSSILRFCMYGGMDVWVYVLVLCAESRCSFVVGKERKGEKGRERERKREKG